MRKAKHQGVIDTTLIMTEPHRDDDSIFGSLILYVGKTPMSAVQLVGVLAKVMEFLAAYHVTELKIGDSTYEAYNALVLEFEGVDDQRFDEYEMLTQLAVLDTKIQKVINA